MNRYSNFFSCIISKISLDSEKQTGSVAIRAIIGEAILLFWIDILCLSKVKFKFLTEYAVIKIKNQFSM